MDASAVPAGSSDSLARQGAVELKMPHWPPAARAAWEMILVAGNILDGAGPCAQWSAATRAKCAQSFGFWLGFLGRAGLLAGNADVVECPTPDLVRRYLDDMLGRCTVETVHMRTTELLWVLRAMRPDLDWRWLASTVARLRRQCRHGELKPRAGVSASEIYEWAHRRMAACNRPGPGSPKRRAVLFREGLTLGLLIARPLRLRSFLNIEIGHHLVETHEGFTLRFAPEDMKDRKARTYALPGDLVEPMRHYLRVHRPVLLAGAISSRLWITKDGRPLSVPGFTGRLAKITRREFGEALRAHAFRHIVATSIALEDPEHTKVIASVLGHATLEMAGRHYNRARRVEALSAWQEMVQEMRREGSDRGRREASRRGRRWAQAPADVAERR